MRIATTAVLALLLALPGVAAFGQSSQQATRTKTTTGTAPTVAATAPEAQDPRVNPNAAGTQMGWRGYAATSGAVSGSSQSAEPLVARPGPQHPRRDLRPARRAIAR